MLFELYQVNARQDTLILSAVMVSMDLIMDQMERTSKMFWE